MWRKGNLYTVGSKCKLENSKVVSQTTKKTEITIWPSNSIPGIYTYIYIFLNPHKNKHIQIQISYTYSNVDSIIYKIWRQPMSANRWMVQLDMWYIYTHVMECTIHKKEMKFCHLQQLKIDLENILLSEISQKRQILYEVTYTWI